jgi:hypothetical protein
MSIFRLHLGFNVAKVMTISSSDTGRYWLSVRGAPTARAQALAGPEENMDFDANGACMPKPKNDLIIF